MERIKGDFEKDFAQWGSGGRDEGQGTRGEGITHKSLSTI
jgi:hypothetical protein